MEQYQGRLVAAYVRGMGVLPPELAQIPPEELTLSQWQQVMECGRQAQLRLYHFKRKDMLPRVKAVMGFLKGVGPESLLDVGSGRGVFLFPFLEEFPWVPVTSLDVLTHRVEMLQAISRGGVERLQAVRQDICTWDLPEKSFDVVTMLEVLEHIPDVAAAVKNAVGLAKRYVVISVPSKEDDNPEHIHLLTKEKLTQLFTDAGCSKLHFDGVNGHLIMTATV